MYVSVRLSGLTLLIKPPEFHYRDSTLMTLLNSHHFSKKMMLLNMVFSEHYSLIKFPPSQHPVMEIKFQHEFAREGNGPYLSHSKCPIKLTA
jgi:hypothetical protein